MLQRHVLCRRVKVLQEGIEIAMAVLKLLLNKVSSGHQISPNSSGLSTIRSNKGRMVHNSDLLPTRNNKGITLLTINSDNSHCPRVFTGTVMVDFKALGMAHNVKATREGPNSARQCHHKVEDMINDLAILICTIKRRESLIDTKRSTFLLCRWRMMSTKCLWFHLHRAPMSCIPSVP